MSRALQPRWPVGQFKGRRIKALPTWYLRWAVHNLHLDDWYMRAAKMALAGKDVPLTDEQMAKQADQIVGGQ